LVIELRVRRLVCQASACEQRTFREHVPELGLRCTLRLTAAVGQVAVTLVGRAGALPGPWPCRTRSRIHAW